MDLIWWLKESKWEARGMPVFGFMLSVRQFVIFGFFLIVGVLASIPFTDIIFKLGAFGFLVLVGILMASIRVRMVPPELQLLYMFRNNNEGKAPAVRKGKPEVLREEAPQEMFADSDVPISFSGSAQVGVTTKVVLIVDGIESASVNVSPASPRYRLLFSPGGYGVGTHELAIKVGSDEVERVKVTIKPRLGIGLLEGANK
jgi:hypothetical protein